MVKAYIPFSFRIALSIAGKHPYVFSKVTKRENVILEEYLRRQRFLVGLLHVTGTNLRIQGKERI